MIFTQTRQLPPGVVFLLIGAFFGGIIGWLLRRPTTPFAPLADERPVPVADAHGQAENVTNGKRDDGLRLVS
jgi:hypothetical protein